MHSRRNHRVHLVQIRKPRRQARKQRRFANPSDCHRHRIHRLRHRTVSRRRGPRRQNGTHRSQCVAVDRPATSASLSGPRGVAVVASEALRNISGDLQLCRSWNPRRTRCPENRRPHLEDSSKMRSAPVCSLWENTHVVPATVVMIPCPCPSVGARIKIQNRKQEQTRAALARISSFERVYPRTPAVSFSTPASARLPRRSAYLRERPSGDVVYNSPLSFWIRRS
jgi:hypothetical protein